MTWKVNFYQTPRGDYPVKEFMKEQDMLTRTRMAQSINLLAKGGPYLKPPYMKKLQDKLYELRIQGVIAIRIFYTVYEGNYYLLHAFKKKTQKTPLKELKVGLDRMKEII